MTTHISRTTDTMTSIPEANSTNTSLPQPRARSTTTSTTTATPQRSQSTSHPQPSRQPSLPSHPRARSNTTTTASYHNFSRPPTSPVQPKSRYFTLKGRLQSFCTAILNPATNPPSKLLDDHFIPHDSRIIEHGPAWAQSKLPYIARPFRGKNEGLWYFRLREETVVFEPAKGSFSGSEGIMVDPEAVVPGVGGRGIGVVSGRGVWRAVKSGRSWEGAFVWRFSGFDEEGRIGVWEVWGDLLSAWDAVGSGGGTPF